MSEVVQADREAAWPFVSRNSIAGTDRDGFLAGKYDDAVAVQAFARHRQASTDDLVEALDGLIELAAAYGLTIDARVQRAVSIRSNATGVA